MDDMPDHVQPDGTEVTVGRFLRSARLCRIRDLEQLLILGELVKDISALIHALQKERGASSIFLGSNGAQFADLRAERAVQCRGLEQAVRDRLRHVDESLDRMSSGARFYTRVALALRALESLPGLRAQITALEIAPQDGIKAFTEMIGSLLGVGFEVADIAADTVISRALVALVNFVQGKEYAGQERAIVGAAFSRGNIPATDFRRVRYLVSAQEQAFRIFTEFADPVYSAAFRDILANGNSVEVQRMRGSFFSGGQSGSLRDPHADAWFEHSTARIDAMKLIEDQMAANIGRLCRLKLTEANDELKQNRPDQTDATTAAAPVAMLVMDVDPAVNDLGIDGGVGLYTLDGGFPKPMHSILEVLQAQSRRLHEVTGQLESARVALTERKVIERAKGLVMKNRRLSETEAYALLRQTAMNQNKRIYEVAEALVSMADILKA